MLLHSRIHCNHYCSHDSNHYFNARVLERTLVYLRERARSHTTTENNAPVRLIYFSLHSPCLYFCFVFFLCCQSVDARALCNFFFLISFCFYHSIPSRSANILSPFFFPCLFCLSLHLTPTNPSEETCSNAHEMSLLQAEPCQRCSQACIARPCGGGCQCTVALGCTVGNEEKIDVRSWDAGYEGSDQGVEMPQTARKEPVTLPPTSSANELLDRVT